MAEHRRSLAHRLYHGETAFDFVGRRRRWFLFSALVIALGLVSLLTRGLNFGIDFEGGTAWEVRAAHVSVAQARDRLRPLGLAEAKIQVLGEDMLRVQAEPAGGQERDRVTAALAQLAGVSESQVSVNQVGPSWGSEVTTKAERALVLFFVAITLYISLRFEWKMALAALAAVVHDIALTVGVTVDSYVVYFERLKDEIRSGKTIRSSVDRGFSRAYRTILAADTASLIGAVLLYVLTVGSVRGFAFFLGLSTLLDMLVAYFFTRPMVVLLGRNRLFTEARWFGVARGLAAAPAGGQA